MLELYQQLNLETPERSLYDRDDLPQFMDVVLLKNTLQEMAQHRYRSLHMQIATDSTARRGHRSELCQV